MLFHSAVLQSQLAAEDIRSDGKGSVRMNFDAVPFTVFTEPEVAWVGLTEEAATRWGIDKVPATHDDRAATIRRDIWGRSHV